MSRAERLSRLWDASAESYHRHTSRYPSHRQITSLLISTLPGEPSSVLDLGCGPGNSTRLLRRHLPDAHLVGLDTAQAMIDIAEQVTPADAKIEYRCQDITTHRASGQRHDLIVCSNSFFHIDDKQALVADLDQLLAPDGRIVISLYDTVFHPDRALRWPLESPTGPRQDPLMDHLLAELRRHGHEITARSEDRQILTEESLSAVFAYRGLILRCTGVLRLVRDTTERVSFLRVPAVAAEVFPTIVPEAVRDALNALDLTTPLPSRQRTVYAFTAART